MSDPTKISRKLVAVFAADVEGYSRLMGADEVGTLKGLTERRAILDRLIGEHRGRIANTAGDSVLAEFGSAVDAVQCAVDPRLHLMLAGMGQALIELRRFDEAIAAGKKALRQTPYSGAYRCLASAFAHLGRDAEARDATAHLLEVDPHFTISAWIARGGPSNAKLLIEGLRKAGLPE
jgi:adenylate cyclase